MGFALYAAPLIRRRPATPSPRGEGYIKGMYLKFQTICNSPLRNGRCPSPQGEATKRLTIFSRFSLQRDKAKSGQLWQGEGFIFPEILKFPQIPVKRRENSWQTPFFLLKSSLWVCAKGISMPFTPIFAVCFHVFLCGIRKKTASSSSLSLIA